MAATSGLVGPPLKIDFRSLKHYLGIIVQHGVFRENKTAES